MDSPPGPMYRLLFPLFLAATAFTQAPSTAEPPSRPAPGAASLGSVSGRVTNEQTGEGVRAAAVRLVPMIIGKTAAIERTATTKADGTFYLSRVMPDTYVVLASHPGYTSWVDSGRPLTVKVTANQETTDVSIQLNPGAKISGVILDSERKPVAKAIVAVFRVRSLHGIPQLRQVGSVAADTSGKYSLPLLDPGSYYIVAGPNAPPQITISKSHTPRLPLVRTFYPKAVDVDDAMPVEVTAGQHLAGVNIILTRSAQYRLRGIIAGFSRLAPRHTTVTLSLRNGINAVGLNRTVRPNQAGAFEIDHVLPGSYTLWLRGVAAGLDPNPMAPARPRIIARQNLDVGNSDILNISLPVMPPIVLTGRISLDSSDSAKKIDLSHVRLTLGALEELPGLGVRSARVASDGSFSFRNLEPAHYALVARNMPAGTYVKSISFNQQDVTQSGIDLTQGESGRVDVLLRPGAGVVEGTLEANGNNSTAVATVILIPAMLPAGGSGLLFGAARPGNSFTIRNVPPGQYYAVAVARYDPAAWQNTDFIRQAETDGTSFAVEENSQRQVQLSLLTVDQLKQIAARLGLSF